MVKEKEYELIGENVVAVFDETFPLYVVMGDKNFLIDSGPAARAPEFFKRINLALEEITSSSKSGIDTLMLTHSHWDHTGGSSYLQQKYDFKVMASHRTVDLLEKPKVISLIDQMNQGYKSLIHSQTKNRFRGLKNLEAVEEGSSIPVDSNHYFKLIQTPGHTKCSVSFLLLPHKILFPGDAAGLMESDCTIRPLFFSDYSSYEHSLEKLLGLEAEVLALPHNRRIKGKKQVSEYLEDSLDKTKKVRTEIEKLMEKGSDTSEVARLIYEQEFPNISFMGPRDILILNLESMVKSVKQERI